jgi:hypothetical protein
MGRKRVNEKGFRMPSVSLAYLNLFKVTYDIASGLPRVALTLEPSRLQRGPHSERGAKPAGLFSDRTRDFVLSHKGGPVESRTALVGKLLHF